MPPSRLPTLRPVELEILVSLADDRAVTRAYGGADGIAAGLRPGTLVLDTSTLAPETVTAVGPLVEKAAPEWLTTLDALLALPEIGGPVGYSGWTALGIRLAASEPRIEAAGFFAGGYVPLAQREEARQVTVPLLVLLQWDDEGNPRQRALDLFDSFGSKEKTLHANLGGHTGTPWFELEDGCRFLDRHLK